MGRHRLFTAKRSGKAYTRVGPTGVLHHVFYGTIWITPSGGLTSIPAIIPFNHDSSAL
jgi:hypothetical protein